MITKHVENNNEEIYPNTPNVDSYSILKFNDLTHSQKAKNLTDSQKASCLLWRLVRGLELGFCVISVGKFPDNQTGENGDEQTDEKMAKFS